MNSIKPYQIRAVQLDLARQMETVTFIKEFIDFIAANGFNTLMLYLEARVRTPSFPYPSADDSYSPEQMREVVDYAQRLGIDVIPCVSCLGHAEQFLEYSELQDMAEVQQGWSGRFGGHAKLAFCPAKEQTRTFLTNYLREICEIFPSKYLHIGFDESFDFACCPQCHTTNFAQEQLQFLDHLKFCHALVANTLGRRVMMWDDMFEFYPDILPDTPRDIIMVYWQYQSDVQEGEGHFLNLIKQDVLSLYDKLGFDYLIAPGDYSAANVRTFTQYADRHRPMGGLVTMWEKSTSFIYRTYPTIAYAGQLWGSSQRDHERVFADAVAKLFGSDDPQLCHVFSAIAYCSHLFDGGYNALQSCSIENRGLDYATASQKQLISACLENVSPLIQTELGRRVADDIRPIYQFAEIRFQLEQEAAAYWTVRELPSQSRINAVIEQLRTLKIQRQKQWGTWRTGIKPDHYTVMYGRTIHSLETWLTQDLPSGIVMVRFCLADKYSGQQCRISLQYSGQWAEVACSVFKGQVPGDAIYSYYFPVTTDQQPQAVRLESWGAGGLGVAYVQVKTKSGCYSPGRVVEVTGNVLDASYILDNDVKAAILGERNTIVTFRDRAAYHHVHRLECDLIHEAPEILK